MTNRMMDSGSERKETENEIIPIAVTLRNAFAVQQINSKDLCRSQQIKIDNSNGFRMEREEYDNDDNDGKDSTERTYPASFYDQAHGEGNLNASSTAIESSSIESQSQSYLHIPSVRFPAQARNEMHGHDTYSITHIPIEMELAAPYALLVQLKHSYKNCEVMRNRISAQFGLGQMDHENSGKNDGDVNRFLPICCWGKDLIRLENGNGITKMACHQVSHPFWDHVNERLDDLYEALIELPKYRSTENIEENGEPVSKHDTLLRNRIWDDIRSHVRVRVSVSEHFSNSSEMGNHPSPKNILAMVPLNPRRLVTLPVNDSSDIDLNTNANGNVEPNILSVSKYNNAIPHSLPRNSILVHFSDGSTRVSPTLYEILLKNNVIEKSVSGEVMSGAANDRIIEVDKFQRRFEDDIFNMLGDGQSPSNDQSSNHSDDYKKVKLKLNDASNHSGISLKGNNNGGSILQGNLNGIKSADDSKGSMRGSFAEAFESLTISSPSLIDLQTNCGDDVLITSLDLSDDDSESVDDVTAISNSTTCSIDEKNSGIQVGNGKTGNESNCLRKDASEDILAKIQDLDDELERLQQILVAEESTLKSELEIQENDAQMLRKFILDVLDLENERIEIEGETLEATQNAIILNKKCIVRRTEILKELRENIFPIQTLDAFTIHGIHLPKDLHSLSAYDEIISAGLGFVCLLVMMCSKYFTIPLRHRLIFNSSRSAVRDCDFDIFPLFKERVVEKEQFDRAIVLLNRNIDYLLQSQGFQATAMSGHILEKLKLLLDHVI